MASDSSKFFPTNSPLKSTINSSKFYLSNFVNDSFVQIFPRQTFVLVRTSPEMQLDRGKGACPM